MSTKTKIGTYLVWADQSGNLRQSDASGQGDYEFEVECFTRDELAECHSIHAAAKVQAPTAGAEA